MKRNRFVRRRENSAQQDEQKQAHIHTQFNINLWTYSWHKKQTTHTWEKNYCKYAEKFATIVRLLLYNVSIGDIVIHV